MSLWMHKKGEKGKSISLVIIISFSVFLLFFAGCRHKAGESEMNKASEKIQMTTSDIYPIYVKFRLFQNTDSSWGYTIFVNSRPYLHYSGVPFKNTGFPTKKDAEAVAGILVKMIKNGDMNPKLNKNITDSLEQIMKNRRTDK